MIMKEEALLAFEEDIRQRTVCDWIRAHTSLGRPVYRYDGAISIEGNDLVFSGLEKNNGRKFSLRIGRDDLEEVRLGFDDVYKRGLDRSMGLAFRPLRISFREKGDIRTFYVITSFERIRRSSKNLEWYNRLKRWMET